MKACLKVMYSFVYLQLLIKQEIEDNTLSILYENVL